MPREKEPAIQDVLDSMNEFASHVDGKFNGIVDEMTGIKGEMTGIKGEMKDIKTRLTKVEATMVTKDYLDVKIADLKGDIVITIRKEDIKLTTLVKILEEKKVMNQADTKRVTSLEPFPQMM